MRQNATKPMAKGLRIMKNTLRLLAGLAQVGRMALKPDQSNAPKERLEDSEQAGP